jgi:hypothetical protein
MKGDAANQTSAREFASGTSAMAIDAIAVKKQAIVFASPGVVPGRHTDLPTSTSETSIDPRVGV